MVNIIVNLSNIEHKYFSHPHYAYIEHIKNIASSFSDEHHRVCTFFHDLGKLSDEFQNYINPLSPIKKRTTHAIEGAFIYFFTEDKIDELFVANFLAILKHHGNLNDIKDMATTLYHDSSKLINLEKIQSILQRSGLDNIAIDLEEFTEFFNDDFSEIYGIESYFLIKQHFSKLTFADKYEAIFHEAYRAEDTFNPTFHLEKLNDLLKNKSKNSKIDRNRAQNEIIQNYVHHKEKRIFILEAPTGVGKTFAALKLALTIAEDTGKKKIITALPFTSIIEQTHREYRKVFDDKYLLKYHHLTSQKNYEEQSEKDQNLQKNDYLTSTWALDNVIVTTFNQLLYAIFSNKNRDLTKFWTLENSIVIIDEVQAFPRFLLPDISQTLIYLAKAFNIHFILMSATIPAIKGFLDQKDSALWTDKLLDPKKYYYKNERYIIKYDNTINSKENLVEKIVAYSENNSVLCVVNTKKFSKNIFDNVKQMFEKNKRSIDNIYLLSTLFTPFHRKCIIRTVRRKLKEDKKVILISTQMIEAGVDIDFDMGFREFSPFGNIIQTAGRINREGRKELCTLYVFEIEGNYHPYDKKDMLSDFVKKNILNKPLLEANILIPINNYFNTAIKRTGKSGLYEQMEHLEFETAFTTFNDNFMKKIPNLTPVFIEIKPGLWAQYREEKEILLQELQDTSKNKIEDKLKQKMEIKIRLKQLEKKLSRFVIDVKSSETIQLPLFLDNNRYLDFTGLKVCEFHKIKEQGQYNAKYGWNGEYWDYGFDN